MTPLWIRPSLIATLVFATGTAALAQTVPVSTQYQLAQVAKDPAAPRLSGFSVVMVEGALSPAGSTVPPDAIPQGAARALADLKSLLPYKSFRLLDTQWILGAGKLLSRLRGPSGERYDLVLTGYQAAASQGSKEVNVPEFQLTNGQDGRPIIHTSFRMDVGETVVVGTSHLQGDKALIVLLTAVAR